MLLAPGPAGDFAGEDESWRTGDDPPQAETATSTVAALNAAMAVLRRLTPVRKHTAQFAGVVDLTLTILAKLSRVRSPEREPRRSRRRRSGDSL
jgi:hypothetical protein